MKPQNDRNMKSQNKTNVKYGLVILTLKFIEMVILFIVYRSFPIMIMSLTNVFVFAELGGLLDSYNQLENDDETWCEHVKIIQKELKARIEG